jgi:CheY-like chemotaxis protein
MKKVKILLVDDDVDILTVMQAILEKEKYTVVTANNKVEGMEKIRNEKPDMAILDVMMSTHYEGFEMAKELRDNPHYLNIPVMMFTSIDVLTTTRADVQAMAREFRQDPTYKEMDVLLVKDINSGDAGVDYKTTDGKSEWVPVDGFVAKPADSKKVVPEVKRLLQKYHII